MRPQVKNILKAGTSLLLLAVILWKIPWDGLKGTWRDMEPLYVVLCLAFSPILIWSSCLKWWVILRAEQAPVRFGFLFKSYLMAYAFSNVMPSNVGGDLVRSYYVGRVLNNQHQAAASVVVERMTGLFLLLMLVAAAPLLLGAHVYRNPAVLLPALAALGGLLLLSVAAWVWQVRPARAAAASVPPTDQDGDRNATGGPRRWMVRLRTLFGRFLARLEQTVKLLRRQPAAALAIVGATLLFYVLTWVNVYLGFRAFGVAADVTAIAALLPTAMAVAMLPVALGSLGLTEGSYVYFFSLAGYAPAATLAMALLLRLKVILIGFAGLFCYVSVKEEGDDERFNSSGAATGAGVVA